MKRITIGRNPNCDIVLDQNMVSRNHALLNIYPSGKYEIVNMGTNGTKVNGTLISNGQPYPVKRGDAVIFAGQCHLDWKQVPNPAKPWRLAIIISAAVIALGLLAWGTIWALNYDWGSGCDEDLNMEQELIELTELDNDSTKVDEATTAEVATPDSSATQSNASRFFPARKKTTSPAKKTGKTNTKPETTDKKPEQPTKPATDTPSESEEWHR